MTRISIACISKKLCLEETGQRHQSGTRTSGHGPRQGRRQDRPVALAGEQVEGDEGDDQEARHQVSSHSTSS